MGASRSARHFASAPLADTADGRVPSLRRCPGFCNHGPAAKAHGLYVGTARSRPAPRSMAPFRRRELSPQRLRVPPHFGSTSILRNPPSSGSRGIAGCHLPSAEGRLYAAAAGGAVPTALPWFLQSCTVRKGGSPMQGSRLFCVSFHSIQFRASFNSREEHRSRGQRASRTDSSGFPLCRCCCPPR